MMPPFSTATGGEAASNTNQSVGIPSNFTNSITLSPNAAPMDYAAFNSGTPQ